jgi:hypothetical protein
MTLYEKVMLIYPQLQDSDFRYPFGTIILQSDADETPHYIRKWEHPVYSRPTDEQLQAVEASQ